MANSANPANPTATNPAEAAASSASAASSVRPGKAAGRRRIVLAAVAVLTFVGVPAYIELKLRRPVGRGPAGPTVRGDAFENVWTDRPVELLGIGDSVTRGLGADRRSHSYFNRLRNNPDDEFDDMRGKCLSAVLPNLTHHNVAVSGSTSPEHADAIERLTVRPDDVFGLVVMTSGGNDLIHSYGRRPPREAAMYGATIVQAEPWIRRFETRLDRMIRDIGSRFPGGCEIYLGDIYDPTDGVGDAPSIFLPDWPDGLAIHRRYNETIHRVADANDHVHVVPLYETFLGHGSHCRQFYRSHYHADDPHYWFYDNIEDPNDRGYDAIRRVYLNTIIANTTLRN